MQYTMFVNKRKIEEILPHFAFRGLEFQEEEHYHVKWRGRMADSSVPPILESDLLIMKLP